MHKYDPSWILSNKMGPNPPWLAKFLVQSFNFKPEMCVLDLACGKGITSVFLAREFGLQVFSIDLLVSINVADALPNTCDLLIRNETAYLPYNHLEKMKPTFSRKIMERIWASFA